MADPKTLPHGGVLHLLSAIPTVRAKALMNGRVSNFSSPPHGTSPKLDREIEQLRRIYTLLFPDTKILVLIVARPPERFERPVELSLDNPHELLMALEERAVKLVINDHLPGNPTVAYRVTADFESAYAASASGHPPRLPFKWRAFTLFRRVTTARAPLLYERLKHIYVMRLSCRSLHSTRRLIYKQPADTSDAPSVDPTPQPKRALVAMHWLDVGGAEKFAVQCCKQLRAAGYDVHVVAAHISKPFYQQQLENFAAVYTQDRQVPPGHEARFFYEFASKYRVGLIHNHHNIYLYNSLPVLRTLGIQTTVIDSLHIDERIGGGFPRISGIWSSYLDYHHVISLRLKHQLARQYVSNDKILFGHLAGDLSTPAQYNIETSLQKKKIRVAFVGRMTWQKRPLIFIAAIQRLRHKLAALGYELSAEVVGDGKYAEAVHAAAHRHHLDKIIRFLPPDSDVDAILKRNDILLIPSENEGITLVAFEAIRNGCIVISTDVGAQRELVPESLLTSAEPGACVKDCVRIVQNLVRSADFRKQVEHDLTEKILHFNNLPRAEDVLFRIYGEQA
ncbi:glycosyltransferase [Burkholderia latens]|nr:glycosyltransferase [Burkholderia latens]